MIHGLDMLVHIRSRGRDRVDSSYCPLQDGNSYGYKKEDLYSKEKIYYTLRLIHLLDKSFI
jgi:hypothetical protein